MTKEAKEAKQTAETNEGENPKEVVKNTPNAPGFFWLKNLSNDDFTPVMVVDSGGELMVAQIGHPSILSLNHYPEERWGMEITPPAM